MRPFQRVFLGAVLRPFCWILIRCFTVGELNPDCSFTEWDVPKDEEWRTSPPVPATAYFDGLCEDLILPKMIPVPGGPSWDY